jgi:hypothetical protein
VDLAELDRVHEVRLQTSREDGSRSSRPIWVVVVAGAPYIRSAFGTRSAWYRHVRADGRAAIEVSDETLEVALEPIDDEPLNRRISDTYRAKYGPSWPGPTETLTGEAAAATTLRLIPTVEALSPSAAAAGGLT